MSSVSLGIAFAFALGLFLCWIFRRVTLFPRHQPLTAQWIEELSVDRYRPMMRLLEPDDLDFLRGQPGFTSRMANKLRVQRCRLFGSYLHNLDQDFQRASMLLRLILLHSSHDRPELAAALIRQEAAFALRAAEVRLKLFLFRWNLCSVDAAGLVKIFDSMRLQLQALVPATADVIA